MDPLPGADIDAAIGDRLTLLPHELAFLLEAPRREVIGLLACGELRNASRDARKRIGFEDARALIRGRVRDGRCSPLAELLLEEMRARRLRVSRSEASWLTHEAALGRRQRDHVSTLSHVST
jgi:hypothetical protein